MHECGEEQRRSVSDWCIKCRILSLFFYHSDALMLMADNVIIFFFVCGSVLVFTNDDNICVGGHGGW